MSNTIKPWEHVDYDGEKLIFKIKEPEFFNQRFKKLGMDCESDEHINWRLANQHIENFNSVDKDKREEIFQCFKKGGINILELSEKFDLSTEIVGDIIIFNIEEISILRGQSL